MTNRPNKSKITKEDVQSALKKLKRRKNYTKDSDITITAIAKEIGCSRNALQGLPPRKKIFTGTAGGVNYRQV